MQYVANGVVFGSFGGIGLIFAYSLVFVTPPWGPRLVKPDERWETIFFIASTALPIATISGVIVALILLRFRTVELRHRDALFLMGLSCFLTASLRPVVSRVQRPGYTPKFELIPDLMVYCLLGLMLVAIVHRSLNRYLCRPADRG